MKAKQKTASTVRADAIYAWAFWKVESKAFEYGMKLSHGTAPKWQ